MKKLRLGLGSYFMAHRFIINHGLWKYIIVPICINIILILALIYFGSEVNEEFEFYIQQKINPAEGSWWSFLHVFTGILVYMLLFISYIFVYKTLILIILSPFLALLSEKVDSLYTGRDFPFSFAQLLKDIWRGIKLSLRNTALELVLLAGLFFCSFIPVIGFAAPILMFLVSSYFFGFAMIDYSNERKKMSYQESKTYINNNKMLAIGIGIVFYALFLIFGIGLIIAPLYGIVAGTLAVLVNDNTQAPYSKPD
ncbi:MAG: EI24 domain-containing protein [Flavobacteriales bacterium]